MRALEIEIRDINGVPLVKHWTVCPEQQEQPNPVVETDVFTAGPGTRDLLRIRVKVVD